MRNDYEPAGLVADENHRIILSRFHWDLITAWADPVLLNDKEKISFVTEWHIPVVHCSSYDKHLGIAEYDDFAKNVSNKVWMLGLSSAFTSLISIIDIDSIFREPPISFSDVITVEPIKKKHIFSISKMTGVLVVGSMTSLPKQVQDKLRELSIRFRNQQDWQRPNT